MSSDSRGGESKRPHLYLASSPQIKFCDTLLEELENTLLRTETPRLFADAWNILHEECESDPDPEKLRCYYSILDEEYYEIMFKEIAPLTKEFISQLLESYKICLKDLKKYQIKEKVPQIKEILIRTLKDTIQRFCRIIFSRIYEKYLSERDLNTNLQKKETAVKNILDSMRNNESFFIAYMDIDGMKALNTAFQVHGIVDQIIIEAAKRIKQEIRETDVLFRLHQEGDEFLVKFNNTDSITGGIAASKHLLSKLFERPVIIKLNEAEIQGLELQKLRLEKKNKNGGLKPDEIKALNILQSLQTEEIASNRESDKNGNNKRFSVHIPVKATIGLQMFKPTNESQPYTRNSAESVINGADDVLMNLKTEDQRGRIGFRDIEGNLISIDPISGEQNVFSLNTIEEEGKTSLNRQNIIDFLLPAPQL